MRRLRIGQREDSVSFVRTIRTAEFIAASTSTATTKGCGFEFHVGTGFRFQFGFDPFESFADVGRFRCVTVDVFQTLVS